jgi:hypothetical protein
MIYRVTPVVQGADPKPFTVINGVEVGFDWHGLRDESRAIGYDMYFEKKSRFLQS